jgi:hypothetical protein
LKNILFDISSAFTSSQGILMIQQFLDHFQ